MEEIKAYTLKMIAVVCGLALLVFIISCGTVEISLAKTATSIWQFIKGIASYDIETDVIYYLRLPRLLLAALIGCGLSVTGCVMQAVMKNPLADPYLLGISSGAGLGAVLAIILGFTNFGQFDAIGCFAFIGAIAVSCFIVLLSLRFSKAGNTVILLSGMALNAVCAACISLIISVYADAERIQNITFWLMGSLQNANWNALILLSIIVIFASLFFAKNARMLNLMLLGDEASITLGYNLAKARRMYIILCALVVALIVYNSGIIGFVGLVVPHIARLCCGSNYKKVLPLSAFIGIVFVTIADVVSRIIIDGTEVPIGIMVSVIGAPVFIYLLLSKKHGYNKR